MIRFVVKEVYLGHVIHAGGDPETRLVSFTDHESLEAFLRYEDQPGEKRPDHVTRQLVGVELP